MNDEAKKIVEELRESACKGCIHDKNGRCMHIQQGKFCGSERHKAADLIEKLSAQLVNQATEYSQALKITTEQRDALKADILRATDKAHEMQSMLDNDVHPNCDYGLYCDLCDALGDVVAWEHKELLDTTPELPEEEV